MAAAAMFAATAAFAADASPVARLYDGPISSIEREMVPLAEAMPADKYNFAPTQGEFKGVRSFAQQVKHTAAVIYLVSAAALKEKPPVDTNGEDGPASAATKEQIVAFLKGAMQYAHKAAQAMDEKTQIEMAPSPFGQGQMARGAALEIATWHSYDHYGQLVVYLRMNGIVPPASRPR